MGDTSLNSVKALIFDLGGVVIDVDFNNVFLRWADYSNRSIEEIKSKFVFDQFYEAHERGEIDSTEYFQSLRQTLGINISDIQFEDGWNSIFNGEIPGISRLLQRAKETVPIYAFTNSNRAHQKIWSQRFSKTLSHFRAIFNSSDIGNRKPEFESFKIVADSIGIESRQMIFYDDSIDNIIGARKAGLHTVHVKSILDIEDSFNDIFGC
jgi:putative hydrolase of the HAD superfamily